MLKKFIQSLVITSIACLSSCNLLLGLPLNENIKYTLEKPINIYINELNNGVITYKNGIYNIKNLNITNEKIELNNENSHYPISNSNYYVDKNGNGFIIFCSNTLESIVPPYSRYYFIKIFNNKIIVNTKQKFFDGRATDFIKILNKDTFYIFSYVSGELIKFIVENNKLNSEKINLNFKSDKNIQINIDEKGNGWIYDDMNESTKYFLKDYNKLEVKDENFIEKDYYRTIKADLDINGNGNILFVKDIKRTDTLINNILSKELYIQKFANLNKISNKELIIKSNEIPSIKENVYDEFSLKDFLAINKDGNGIIFFNKKVSNKDDFEYLYMKKVKNFKIDDKEIQLTESNKYVYSKFAINEKGNGLIVLKENNKDSCVIKKIRNYDIEK